MKSFQKILFSSVFILVLICFLLTGCVNVSDLPANKWLTVESAEGYLYDSTSNNDILIDAMDRGFTTEKISDDDEWNTPSLRYKEIKFNVPQNCKILGMAFELKTNIKNNFLVRVEAQIYKQIKLPDNWDNFTDEEKINWEKENCIQDRQFDSITVGNRADAVSFSFNEEKATLDTSCQIRIIFTSIDDENVTDISNYLKNFMVDNFIIIAE